MSYLLSCGTVRESRRRAIHVVRVNGEILDWPEIDELAERMRERLAKCGEPTAEVVVVQGYSTETLRLFGDPYSVHCVRAAMLSASLRWSPLKLD
jgi:hypothetical protein